jgi:hypothetical protein
VLCSSARSWLVSEMGRGGGGGASRAKAVAPSPPVTPRAANGGENAPRVAVSQMESAHDLVVLTRGLQNQLVEKANQLRRELHFLTKDKVRPGGPCLWVAALLSYNPLTACVVALPMQDALAAQLAACEQQLKQRAEAEARPRTNTGPLQRHTPPLLKWFRVYSHVLAASAGV